MTKVWLLLLFIRTDIANVPPLAVPVGDYPTLTACQEASSAAMMRSDEEPREWEPLVAQWVCVPRPSK